jgi:hypothetical protein
MFKKTGKGISVNLHALCVLVVFLLFSAPLFSQKRDSIYDPKKQVIIKGNKFKYYNNWISAGAGYSDNFTRYGQEFTLGADYNFHIRMEYFQLGFYFNGERFGEYNNYNYHAGYGRRIENNAFNFSAFAGLAVSTGYKKKNDIFNTDLTYTQLGLYTCVQAIKKLTYDTGIGISVFYDINPYQNIGGARLDIYFSGAYKGKSVNGR